MNEADHHRYPARVLAIDIGGTKVDVGVVDVGGAILDRRRITVAEHPRDLADAVVEGARSLLNHHDAVMVGVACAGPMTRNGETVSPLNIPQWRDFPLRAHLADGLQREVVIEGDVRALALAEGRFGKARGLSSYFSMVVSTGVGGAIVLDGRLADGDSGNAGHIGHLHVVENGARCSCGAEGCLEAEASGWAIERRTGRSATDADEETRDRTARLVGRAVGTLASVLDINHCFIAGSVALGFGERFFAGATAAARRMAPMAYSQTLTIEPSGLGVDGPLLGAALVAGRGGA